MMRVESKRCHVSDAFAWCPWAGRWPHGPATLTPNRGMNKARVSRHVRVPSVLINFWIIIQKRGYFFLLVHLLVGAHFTR